jgi:hypothetical protein
MKGVGEFVNNGAKLGHLWVEGHFEVGDPLAEQTVPGLSSSSGASSDRGDSGDAH